MSESGFSSEEVLNVRYPLHRACRDGDIGALCSLLQHSANKTDLATEDSFYGWTPIHWAAHFGKVNTDVLRNASGLTAADLAHAQGFQECAQLLSNVQNQLNQLNGFYTNGVLSGVYQSTDSRVHFSGGPRKRSLEYLESDLVKKARTEGLDLPMKMYSGAEEELEIMHTESAPPVISGAPLAADVSHNGLPGKVMGNGFVTNGHVPQPQLDGMEAEPAENGLSIGFLNPGSGAQNGSQAPDMCGSLYLGGSPSSCVSHRPSWAPANPYERGDPGDTLQYGHYHGFGDTAESIPEASSMAEHSRSVKVEQRYDNAVYSAMHLFHGS
ncbi:UNVERIFIED_CONTAM: hypothetical protein FKN15_029524 [Acipenser sinensis]